MSGVLAYEIRFQNLTKKKFFMKFLNNFITQGLTPFLFSMLVGGYLAIKGGQIHRGRAGRRRWQPTRISQPVERVADH